MSETLADLTRRKLSFLFDEHGLAVTEASDNVVRLESSRLGAVVVFDPRGELDVDVFELDGLARWSYVGMVGRASLERLFELAAAELRPRIR